MAPHLKGLLLSATGMVVISPDGMLVKLVQQADSLQIVFWRTLLTAVTLSLVLVVLRGRGVVAHVRGMGRLGVAAALMVGLSNISFVVAMTLTTVANTLVVLATMPLFGAVSGLLLIGERVRPRTWGAIALAMAGVVILLAGSVGLGGGSLAGDLVALGIPLFMGLALVLLRKAGDRDTVPVVALGGLASALLVLPFCDPWAVGAEDMMVIVLMGVLVTPLALSLYTSGARYLPAAEVALLALIETVLGPVWAWAVVGEVPTPLTLAGGALVVGAIAGNSMLALARRPGGG
ncbi:DMT family transporter [Roseospira visakhapatnamensis]|uniref:Drug/metabolite transporter (DMT)-like permease n=1 Tax=Roseospira visakhapatnamensis TaxID=390880 RepID=A0A7W6RHG6_9PROT|nr:DMT family transporter [Roseospira visakhapatnamensis]MBB4268066.1 drug/metabolite transporter (DMT)-like permease [Roseospira visakhapatnamensis]